MSRLSIKHDKIFSCQTILKIFTIVKTHHSAAWLFCMTVNTGLVTDVRYPHGFYRRMSNGETESAKTMLVEDSESDQATTPSKDGTLVIRPVRGRDRNFTDCNVKTTSC